MFTGNRFVGIFSCGQRFTDTPQSPGRLRTIGAVEETALAAQVATAPDATLAEHCAQWATAHGVTLSPTTMGRTLQRLRLPLKKRR